MSPGGRLWITLSACLGMGALIGWWVPSALWDWQPALAAAQPWRWWTAAFVHWSPMHLLANLIGLVVVGALGHVAAVPAVVAMAWLASWPLLHLALLLRPELAHYGGLSGLLHGGVAAAALYLACVETRRRRQIAVAPLAHVSGALLAALCTLIALARGPGLLKTDAMPTRPEVEPSAAANPETS